MGTQGVNGANNSAFLQELAKYQAKITAAGTDESKKAAAQQELLKFVSDNPDLSKYTKVEKGPEGTAEERDARAAAQKKAADEVAEMKKATQAQGKPEEAADKPNVADTGAMELQADHEPNVKVNPKIAQQEQIEDQRQYTNKDRVKEEFGSDLTAEQWEALENNYKAAEKELKAARKANKKVKNHGDSQKFGEEKAAAIEKQNAAQAKFLEIKEEYDREKALRDISKGNGSRGIRKAAERNVKNMENVLNTQHVFLSKDEEEAAIKANPELKGKTEVLKNKDINNLVTIASYADYKIKQAEKTGDPEAIQNAKDKYEEYTKIFAKKEDGSTDYSKVDARAAQDALVDLSGFDERFNADEVEQMSKMYGTSKSSLRSTVKKFGFGTESLVGQRFKAAGITAAATALGSLLSIGKTHSHKTASASASAQGETVQGEVSWIASNGEEFYKYYEAKGGDAAVSVVADACAKIPVIGQVAGPALAGITAFFLAKPGTEDAFNGATVEAVLEDLNNVKGKDNKGIVAQIQKMDITGDPSKDAKIKASVLKAALGENTTKANTEELLAAYEYLKDARDAIGKIEDELETRPKPPAETPAPTPVPVPEEKYYTDYEIKETVTHDVSVPVVPGKSGSTIPVGQAYTFVDPEGNEHDFNDVVPSIARRNQNKTYLAFDKQLNTNIRYETVNGKRHFIYPKTIDLGNGWVVNLKSDDPKEIYDYINGTKMGNVKSKQRNVDKGSVNTEEKKSWFGSETNKEGSENLGGPGDDYKGQDRQDVHDHFEKQGHKFVENKFKNK